MNLGMHPSDKHARSRESESVKERGGVNRNSSRDNSFHGLPGCYSSLCKGTPGGREVIIFTHILWKDAHKENSFFSSFVDIILRHHVKESSPSVLID